MVPSLKFTKGCFAAPAAPNACGASRNKKSRVVRLYAWKLRGHDFEFSIAMITERVAFGKTNALFHIHIYISCIHVYSNITFTNIYIYSIYFKICIIMYISHWPSLTNFHLGIRVLLLGDDPSKRLESLDFYRRQFIGGFQSTPDGKFTPRSDRNAVRTYLVRE